MPTKPPEDRRSAPIKVRLEPGFHAEVEAAAAAARQTVSEFVRSALVAALANAPKRPKR